MVSPADAPNAARVTQRLQDAGVMAGRMAHDFDNVLTGVLGFAELTLPLLPPNTPQHNYVSELLRVVQTGMAFTQQMHQFSRSGQQHPRPSSLVGVWEQESGRLRGALGDRCRLVADVPPTLPQVQIEAEPLKVVLMHLVNNACEAMSAGGTLSVAARRVELSAADCAELLGAAQPGPFVTVSVADTGPGIRPEVRGRLFLEPFYTTKARHRGLGLAVVYRTLQAHGGGIRLDAGTPQGTVARVFLPAAGTPSSAAGAPHLDSHPSGVLRA
jgi:signal transduction histidine kinase